MMSTHNDAGDVSSTSQTNSGYDGGNLQSMQSRTKWEEPKEKSTQGSHSSCQRGGSLQKWLAHPQSFRSHRKQRRSSKKGPVGDSKRMYKAQFFCASLFAMYMLTCKLMTKSAHGPFHCGIKNSTTAVCKPDIVALSSKKVLVWYFADSWIFLCTSESLLPKVWSYIHCLS